MPTQSRKKRRNSTAATAAPSPARAPLFWHSDSLVALLLVLVAFSLYGSALDHPLVFDDVQLTETFLRGYGRSLFALDLRWFAYASLGWTYEWFGQSSAWLRAGNVLLHGATAVVLYQLISRFLEDAGEQREGACPPRVAAALCALIFVLHPVAVYATAYVIQRSTVMATMFSLLALLSWRHGLVGAPVRRLRWRVAAIAAYFVAVFCKEHVVMLPLLAAAMTCVLWGAPPRENRFEWREMWGYAALAALIAALVVMRARGVLGTPYEPFAQGAITRLAESSAGTPMQEGVYLASMVNQGYLFFQYLLAWAVPWPGWMSIDLRPEFPGRALAWPQAAGFVAWLLWGAGALWLLSRCQRSRVHALSGLSLLCPWLLSLTEFAAVRIQEPLVLYRSYAWMVGLMVLPALLLIRVSWRTACIASLVFAVVCAGVSVERLGSLSSEFKVWDDAVRKLGNAQTPLADRPWRNRGVAHYHLQQYESAGSDFEQALKLNPRDSENWLARGTLYMRTARSDAALADFDRALALSPNDKEALGRRCIVNLRLQRLDAARNDCLRARDLDPRDATIYVSLGMVFAIANNADESERHYRTALSLAPTLADAHYQLAVLLAGTGRGSEAAGHFSRACSVGLGTACERLKR